MTWAVTHAVVRLPLSVSDPGTLHTRLTRGRIAVPFNAERQISPSLAKSDHHSYVTDHTSPVHHPSRHHIQRLKPTQSVSVSKDDDLCGVVNVSWHPTRAQSAVAVGKNIYCIDGASGAVLSQIKTPIASVAIAHAPAVLGAQLCALLRDGSLHAVDFSSNNSGNGREMNNALANNTRRLHLPTVNVKKKGLADPNRRGFVTFSLDVNVPWVVFALAGDVTLRAASLSHDGSSDLSSPTSNSPTGFGSSSGSSQLSSSPTSRSTSTSSFFGTKKPKYPPGLLKIKNEHKKPIACLGSMSNQLGNCVIAGYVDGSVRVYDLLTQTGVASFSLPLTRVSEKKRAKGVVHVPDDVSSPTSGDVSSPTPKKSKVPPPPTGIVFLQSGGDQILCVADVAGRLTSWCTLPKIPVAEVETGFGGGSNPEGTTSATDTHTSSLQSFGSKPLKKPTQPKKPKMKTGPGGLPLLDLLHGVHASDGGAPVFQVGGLPDGGSVVLLAGVRSRTTGSARSAVRTFTVNSRSGVFSRIDVGSNTPSSSFPPLPPATHRVVLAAHPTQSRISVVASSSNASKSSSFAAFFALRADGTNRHSSVCDIHEVEHVSTMDTATARPPLRKGKVYYLGDANSIWSVSLADGPKAARMVTLPVPPQAAADAAPVRIQVAVTPNGDAEVTTTSPSSTLPPSSHKRSVKEQFLVLSKSPNVSHPSVATLVDGSSGVTVTRVPSRDAVFVGETKKCFAALDAEGVTIGVHSCETPSSRLAAYFLGKPCSRIFPGPTPNALSVCTDVLSHNSSSSSNRQVFAVVKMRDTVEFVSNATIELDPNEHVMQVAWQQVGVGFTDSGEGAWGGLAVLTSDKLLLFEYTLGDGENSEKGETCVLSKKASTKNAHQKPVYGFMWVGPALVFTHSDGSSTLGWDGSVNTVWANGLSGGSPTSLATATEDGVLCFCATNSGLDAPCAFFRPVSVADVLALGWGSLLSSRVRGNYRDTSKSVHGQLQQIAQRAIASGFQRHDASRVSAAAIGYLSFSLGLPGLAANVASRATHVSTDVRALTLAKAKNAVGAMELVRADGNKATDPATFDPAAAARATPGVLSNALLLTAVSDSCEAACALGDAETAFSAACTHYGLSGGNEQLVLEKLFEQGVCCSEGGDGGFPVLDALAESKLAPGLARQACAVGARRRVRKEQKYGRMVTKQFDPTAVEHSKVGDQIPLGWSATPSAVFPDTIGGPKRETSRVSVLTHADALGKRVLGSAPFGGGVEGDGMKVERQGSNGSGVHRPGFGGSRDEWRRPEPLRIPHGGDPGGVTSTSSAVSPGVVAPPPPPFQANFSDEFNVSSSGDEDPSGDGSDSDGDPFGRGERGQQSFASFPPEEQHNPAALALPGPDAVQMMGVPPSSNTSFQVTEFDQGSSGNVLGAQSHDPPPPMDGFGTTATVTSNEFAAFPQTSDPFGSGFSSGFGASPFDAGNNTGQNVFSSVNGGNNGELPFNTTSGIVTSQTQRFSVDDSDPFASSPAKNTGDGFAVFSPPPPPTTARVPPPSGSDPFGGGAGMDTQGNSAPPQSRTLGVHDPFSAGDSDDEDPFGDAAGSDSDEAEVAQQVASAFAANSFGSPLVGGGVTEPASPPRPVELGIIPLSVYVSVPLSPVRVEKPKRPRQVREVTKTYPETLRFALSGIASLEKNDYDAAELCFKAATKLAVTGHAPSMKAAVKLRTYAVASRVLRLAKAVAGTIEGEGGGMEGNDASGNSHLWRSPSQRNLGAARELSRLSRHLCALPLDFKHRVCVVRFAAAWHVRAGLLKRAGEFLAVAASAIQFVSQFEGQQAASCAFVKLNRIALACADGKTRYGDTDGHKNKVSDSSESSGELEIANAGERPGWVCAATLQSLKASHSSSHNASNESNENDDSLHCVECPRCRTTHSMQFVKSGGACAVCDQPLRGAAS